MWTDDFIEIPFKPDGRDRNGCDCWGLVCLVYREKLGIELPEYKGVFEAQTIAQLKNVARVMEREKESWVRVEKPHEFDVVMIRSGAYAWHVGIVIDRRRMLHVMSGINSTVEEYTGMDWKNRIEEFRRYVAS
jgi:cell wall-associated NlpC family hydrolase